MKRKFFNKDLERKCEYCIHARIFSSNDEMLCKYKGVVSLNDKCRKFKYDVLKRKPNITKLGDDYTNEDFVLWF